MNIHEYQAKELLAKFGVPVPAGHAAMSADEAVAAAGKLPGPLYVVKAQIHAGGRGKGKFTELGPDAKGGVRLARSADEVRAAAVEGLGHLGDPGCVPALLRALPDASRHQRARVVESIRELGPGVGPALVAHARLHPDDLATVAELIGFTGAASAHDDLLAWSSHGDPKVRAAALQALGSLGLDDRAYYYALRALGDASDAVRAMAARAGSTTVEIDSSHVAMMSHPSAVVSLIKAAARS